MKFVRKEAKRVVKINYKWLQLLRVTVERIGDLPRRHDGDVNGQQHANDDEQLVIFDDFLVQLQISENRVNSPRLREHRAESETEPSHQQPSTRGADVGEGGDAAEAAVHSQENYAQVRQHAADDDQIIQVRTRHFDVPLISELDVDDEEADGENNSEHGAAGENHVDR